MAFLHLVVVEQATLLMRWELAHCSKVTAWREAFTDLKDAPAVYLVLLSPRANAGRGKRPSTQAEFFGCEVAPSLEEKNHLVAVEKRAASLLCPATQLLEIIDSHTLYVVPSFELHLDTLGSNVAIVC
jgi:hypothetical protein